MISTDSAWIGDVFNLEFDALAPLPIVRLQPARHVDRAAFIQQPPAHLGVLCPPGDSLQPSARAIRQCHADMAPA